MKIRLTKVVSKDPNDRKQLTMTVESETWPDLMDEFVTFLNAAGFAINCENIEAWVDAATETLPAPGGLKKRRRV